MGTQVGLKYRNRVNQVSGWIAVVTSYAVNGILDPMGGFLPRGGVVGRGPSLGTLIVSLTIWLFAAFGYLYFARPFVTREIDCLYVRNPLAIIRVPLNFTLDEKDYGRHPVVLAANSRVRLYALEQSNLMLLQGKSLTGPLSSAAAPITGPPVSGDSFIRREIRVLDPILYVLIGSFVIYVALSALL